MAEYSDAVYRCPPREETNNSSVCKYKVLANVKNILKTKARKIIL